MGKNQHVVPTNGRWGIKGEGNSKLTSTFKTQSEAVERELVKYHEISNQSFLSMVVMVVFENVIHTGMIRVLHVDNYCF